MDNFKKMIGSATEIGIALLALAIILALLVGPTNMYFLGDVATNITDLISTLGAAGLPGLIALGVILAMFNSK